MESQNFDRSQRRCAFCDGAASIAANLMKCSGCLITYYCNRDHQVQDWKRHKQLCKELQAKRLTSSAVIDTREKSESIQTASESIDRSCDQASISHGAIEFEESSISDHDAPINRLFGKTLVEPTPRFVQTAASTISAEPVQFKLPSSNISVDGPNSEAAASRRTSMKPQTDSQKRPRRLGGPPGPKKAKRLSHAALDDRASTSEKVATMASISVNCDEEYGPKKDHSSNHPLDLDSDGRLHVKDAISTRLERAAQFAAAGLREYGWAIVDKFIGERHCRATLNEMQKLYEKGQFTDARLLNSKVGTQLHGIRSDLVLFLTNGSDDGIHIGLFVALIDSLIFQLAGSVPPYNICGRTRPMLTCYPGQRSRYLTHVDNPDKDGRCITATYYLNEDWRPAHGGLLRLYPTSSFKPVDVEPIFDRLVLYWSDRRNPHEILPSYRKRFSINTWYYDSDQKMAADAHHFDSEGLSPVQSCC